MFKGIDVKMTIIKEERLVVFDFIRLVAILLVVFSHTLKVGDLPFDVTSLGKIGNAVFFFISGYLIYLNNKEIKSKNDVLQFYKKRMLRIYPLYILAVIIGLIVSTINGSLGAYSTFEIIVSLLGLQMVFYPVLVNDPLILWFIGMIVIFYIIYPLVMLLCHGNIKKYAIYSCIIIGFLAIIKILTGFIGGGVFEYYFVFVAGVIVAWRNLFESKYINKISSISIIVFIICSAITLIFQPSIGELEHVKLTLSIAFYVGIIIFLRIIHGITTVFVLWRIFNAWLPGELITKFIIKGAFASYSVYLFHGIIFGIIGNLTSLCGDMITSLLSVPLVYDIVLILVFIPIVFIMSYYIQYGENICMRKLKSFSISKHH